MFSQRKDVPITSLRRKGAKDLSSPFGVEMLGQVTPRESSDPCNECAQGNCLLGFFSTPIITNLILQVKGRGAKGVHWRTVESWLVRSHTV